MAARRLPRLSKRAALLGAALWAWPSPGATTAREGTLSNPPLGHTGGFGEPTCQACHADAALNEPTAALTAEGLPDSYARGAAYQLTLSITGSGQGRNGFQAAARFADGPQRGLQAGTLSPIDRRTQVATDTLTGVQYASHSDLGAEPVSLERGTWVIEWTAPDSDGPVVLHVAANSANGDNSPLGDLIHTLARVSQDSTK